MSTHDTSTTLQAPFPWFGGKSRVAHLVWERFGDVPNYVEPFFGSGAVLLGRPHAPRGETVNDIDGLVANFWRALAADPEAVARYADWPVNENDLHARHVWLRAQTADLTAKLEGNPDYYDPKIAGWWVWGISCWIGGGWCGQSGSGPWTVVDGLLVRGDGACQGVTRRRPQLGNGGRGVTRKQPLVEWFAALSNRLRRVRVCSGDWTRVVGPTPTIAHGVTGVFLDPPYGTDATRDPDLYRSDGLAIASDVRQWALDNGANNLYRIALCGYEGEHQMPDDWKEIPWKPQGGYAHLGNGQGKLNAARERIWFSPHCLNPELF